MGFVYFNFLNSKKVLYLRICIYSKVHIINVFFFLQVGVMYEWEVVLLLIHRRGVSESIYGHKKLYMQFFLITNYNVLMLIRELFLFKPNLNH